MRTLTMNEIESVTGGWVPIVGGIAGGLYELGEALEDDDEVDGAELLQICTAAVLGAGGFGLVDKLGKAAKAIRKANKPPKGK
jgi:lactobin A/cerein 7B family class IIb bacteriocin